MSSLFSTSPMVEPDRLHILPTPPPTLKGAVQSLGSARADSVFTCSAMVACTRSRCKATYGLPADKIDAAVDLIQHEKPPYNARQAIIISRLLLCTNHYQQTEYSSSLIISLVEAYDPGDEVWTTDADALQPHLSIPRSPDGAENNTEVPHKHDSHASESPTHPPPPTSLGESDKEFQHAGLNFSQAQWEVLFRNSEFRCIGYVAEHARCQWVIKSRSRRVAQDLLHDRMNDKLPAGKLRPLLQEMLCTAHNTFEWLHAYEQKWADDFLPDNQPTTLSKSANSKDEENTPKMATRAQLAFRK